MHESPNLYTILHKHLQNKTIHDVNWIYNVKKCYDTHTRTWINSVPAKHQQCKMKIIVPYLVALKYKLGSHKIDTSCCDIKALFYTVIASLFLINP